MPMFGTTHNLVHPDHAADLPDAPDDLTRLLALWRAARRGRALPAKTDLAPADMVFCLGHLALTEVEHEPFRIRYRLVGTRLVALYGREITGRYVDELYTLLLRREVMSHYRLVVEARRPLYSVKCFDFMVKRLGYYRLMLPLSWQDPDRVDIVLVAIYPLDATLRRADEWRTLDEVKAYLAAFPEENFDADPLGTAV